MDLSNLFGYEEQQQQPLVQPQKVNDVKDSIIQIKSNISKRGIKQNKKLNQFKQTMALKPNKKKARIQLNNCMKEQVPINNLGTNWARHPREETLRKILEYSETLRNMLCDVDNFVKQQQQEPNDDNKLLIQKQEISIDNLYNCLIGCLLQFTFVESSHPNQFSEKQNNFFSQSLIPAQNSLMLDNILLNQHVEHPLIRFSETYKHESIKLDKARRSATSKLYGCAICEESLSQAFVTKFAFKIKKIDGNIAIGLCNKDILAQQNYQHTDSNQTQGLYLLDNFGRVYPNRENQVMQGQSFEFEESNIIIVIFDFQKQYIKWKKYNHQSIFCIPFDIHNEVFPCVLFSKSPQFKKTSQVRIVNPKTLRKIDRFSKFDIL
ncbi:unnamed protein product [Paramecium octaurelia]|uniref:Uncharacterized protein n=1 Tax=Paramecium octaurelia TaxID=43137 RepID=A0A8S1W450_PAROT|nr:unnamed protein product [Paramecium octaurelia]